MNFTDGGSGVGGVLFPTEALTRKVTISTIISIGNEREYIGLSPHLTIYTAVSKRLSPAIPLSSVLVEVPVPRGPGVPPGGPVRTIETLVVVY